MSLRMASSMWLLSLLLIFPFQSSAISAVDQSDAMPTPDEDFGGIQVLDGVPISQIPRLPTVPQIISAAIPRDGWSVTCDSEQPGFPCSNVLDGSNTTYWSSTNGTNATSFPHWIIIDMQTSYLIGNISILPRQDGSSDGNIGGHNVTYSQDGQTWANQIVIGTYMDVSNLQISVFTPVNARYVKIFANTEAGGRGPWTSMAEVNVYAADTSPPPPITYGAWAHTIDFPLVPVSAMVEVTTGHLLVWSAWSPAYYQPHSELHTITAELRLDIFPHTVSPPIVTNTQHDMFCEGLSMNANGGAIATGGNDDTATSIYDVSADDWTISGQLHIPRGYQAQVTISDGRAFTIGGGWSDWDVAPGGKNGEIFDPTTGTWRLLPGALVDPMYTDDPQTPLGYRNDNHAMLFAWKNNTVFQAGPSLAMNWYGVTGNGTQAPAGDRTGSADVMCGNAVMYDAVGGKILVVGGAPYYQDSDATSGAQIITLGTPFTNPTVTTIPNMTYPRSFANSVILPNGQVFITGGQSYAVPFTDTTAQLVPEIFDPATNTFTPLAPLSVPRNYHSTALLLLDGSVINAGGGLCGVGCAQNHYDSQVFFPPYLYDNSTTTTGQSLYFTRVNITSVSPQSIKPGGTLTVTTDAPIASVAMIRMSATTHTVNTDQRYISLTESLQAVQGEGNTYTYTVDIPSDPGVVVPGYWSLWVLDKKGTPGPAAVVQVLLAG